MTNVDYVKSFNRGIYIKHYCNLFMDKLDNLLCLRNWNTIIAVKDLNTNSIYINNLKFSQTTSRIQSIIINDIRQNPRVYEVDITDELELELDRINKGIWEYEYINNIILKIVKRGW